MDFDGQFAGQFAVAQDFNSLSAPVGRPGTAQSRFIDGRAVLKSVERFQIDGDIADGKTGVVKAAFGNAANQRHLSAFKTNADGTAGPGRLAFSAAPAGLAVTTGLPLAEAFAAMLGTGTRFEIV